jgi:hypothetical protein
MKKCTLCGREKSLEYFDVDRRSRDGRTSKCIECRREYNMAAYYRKRDGLPGLRPAPVAPGVAKVCADCKVLQPLDRFVLSKKSLDGRGSYCKPCHNVRSRASRERNGGSRTYHLTRRYGITSAEVNAMIEAQGGVCLLCRERKPEHVDHDHVTGVVRGVLCSCCNQGLGNFRDSAGALRKAIDYLERTTWQSLTRGTQHATGVYRLTSPRLAARRSASSSALQRLISSRGAGSSPPA